MQTRVLVGNLQARSNYTRRILWIALAALAALILSPLSARAQSCPGSTSWSGGTGTWETAGNWSSGVPGSTSSACINVANSTVDLAASSGDTTLNLDVNLSTDIVNIENDSELIVQSGGNIFNNGAINIQSSGSSTWIILDGNTTLSGTGSVTMSNNSANAIWAGGGTAQLTNQQTIQGAGNIGSGGNFTLINSGTIDANQSAGLQINVDSSGGVTNTGTLEASAGGTLTLTGGGAITNTGGLIESSGAGSVVVIANTSITGGTLTSNSGGVFESGQTSGVTPSLTNVTLSTGTTLDLANDFIVNFGAGTITNNGTINMQSSGSGTWIQINGAVTLSGTGNINMSNNGGNLIFAEGGPATLTNNQTIQGAGGIGNGTALTFVNNGTVDATQATALIINTSAPITNAGTLEATAGGTLELNGTITNTGALIEASGTGSTVLLDNVNITGGTLTSTSGGIFQSGETSGATPSLTSVTLSTGTIFDLPNDYVVNFGAGTITNNGTINMQSSGSGTWILVAGSTTLAGSGTVNMTNNASNEIFGGGTLTNNETIQGGGTIGNNNLTLINTKTIDATGTITLDPNGGTTNTGTLEATAGGTLILDDAINNTGGTILATGTGSTVELSSVSITGGTLTSSSGGVFESVLTSGSTPSLTNVTISAGTILNTPNDDVITFDAGTITNKGTINLESSGSGTWIQINGAVTLAGTGKVVMSANANNAILGTGTLTNDSTIEGEGNIGNGQIVVNNEGTIEANETGTHTPSTLFIDTTTGGFTNNVGTKQGTLSVSTKNTIDIEGAFNNYNSSTGELTGGIYKVTGTLEFNAGTLGIVTNDANITLTSATGKILNTNESDASALSGFNDNASGGTFTVDSTTFTTGGNFTNSGTLGVGSGAKFAVGASGADSLTNFNSGTSTLTGGTYILTGTGQIQFNNGGDASDIVTNDAKITLAGVDTTKSNFIDQTGANALANFAANGSTGSLTLTTDRNYSTPGNFTNAGTVDVQKSTGTGHTLLTISGNYTQTGGTTTVDGMLTATGAINVSGGFVYGNLGTITGNVTLTGGTLSPGDGVKKAGKLSIAGNYTQSGSGILDIDLGGTTAGTNYDVLNISGLATLGGTLDVDAIGTYKPTAGQQYDILNYGSESGAFTSVDCTFSNGDGCTIAYDGTEAILTITAAPAPASASLTSASGAPARWTRSASLLGSGTGLTHEPSAILTPAESCSGLRTFASFACLTKAFSGVRASVGPAARISSGSERASTTFSTLHNNVAAATSGSGARYGAPQAPDTRTASAASIARLYVCAYLPSEVASTMGCR